MLFRMKKVIWITLLSVAAVLALIAVIASCMILFRGEQLLTVSGSGSVLVEPDISYVRLGVEVLRSTAQRAQSANASIMQDVIAAIEKQGVKKEDIGTSDLNIWQELRYEADRQPRPAGWRCSDQLTIKIEDMSRISKVIDSAVNAGATNVQGISFERKKDSTAAKKQALQKAMNEAQAKAEAIAQAAGLRIVAIKNISENGMNAPYPVRNDAAFKMMNGAAQTPINPMTLEMNASVSVVYQVE